MSQRKLHPDVARILAVIAEERRQRRLDDYRRDSLLVQEGKQAEAERLQAWEGYQRFEPDEETPCAD